MHRPSGAASAAHQNNDTSMFHARHTTASGTHHHASGTAALVASAARMSSQARPQKRFAALPLAGLIALALAGCAHLPASTTATDTAPAAASAAADTARIRFTPAQSAGYPEGIAWHPGKQAFLVSSLRGGTIGLVSPDGQYRVFAGDPRLITTTGIRVDEARNRVLVLNSDPGASHRSGPQTVKRTAQVVELALDSGEVRRIHDLSHLSSGPTMANDLAVDQAGNIYVTDSFQPQIYRIDQATGTASVLVRDPRLGVEKPGTEGTMVHLNGIVFHPDGFLLAGDYTRGQLWKIPLQQPAALQAVRLPARLTGPDGLVLRDGRQLVAVQTAAGADGQLMSEVSLLTSDDGWQSARVSQVVRPEGMDAPTTATLRDGAIWVTNARFTRLFADPSAADQTREFELHRVTLD
ncbi:MAG: SMP-30/gluconolactonase/LRE family protein [Lautropia sp.]|nr:SMP-30/gluconolactonase/LRE family protein [Lautropia sp.]